MHQVFAIFLRDVKRILKNPVALVVTLGVAIIPSPVTYTHQTLPTKLEV